MRKAPSTTVETKALLKLIPALVTIPIVVTFQVTALMEWPMDNADENERPLPWVNLSLKTRKALFALVKADLLRFKDWIGSDYLFTQGGGSFVLERAELLSKNMNDMPVVQYVGNMVIQPGTNPDVITQNRCQSRNMIAEMVSGVFAHYEFAGDDSATIVSITFPLPHADLLSPWQAYNDASNKIWDHDFMHKYSK
jgi:hypothetical protein